jgi:hypothetical protein
MGARRVAECAAAYVPELLHVAYSEGCCDLCSLKTWRGVDWSPFLLMYARLSTQHAHHGQAQCWLQLFLLAGFDAFHYALEHPCGALT